MSTPFDSSHFFMVFSVSPSFPAGENESNGKVGHFFFFSPFFFFFLISALFFPVTQKYK